MRFDHHGPDLEDPLPVVHHSLTALQTLPPHLSNRRPPLGHQLVLDDLLELGQHLDAHHRRVGSLVALQRQRGHLGVEHVPRQVDQLLGLRPLLVMDAEHRSVESAILRLTRQFDSVPCHRPPVLLPPSRDGGHPGHLELDLGAHVVPVLLGNLVHLSPLAEGLEAAHLAQDQVGVAGCLRRLLFVNIQRALPVVQLLIPVLLDLELSVEVLVGPLEEAGGGLLLAELVVDLDEGLQDGHVRLAIELVLLVVEGLGVGATSHGDVAEEDRG